MDDIFIQRKKYLEDLSKIADEYLKEIIQKELDSDISTSTDEAKNIFKRIESFLSNENRPNCINSVFEIIKAMYIPVEENARLYNVCYYTVLMLYLSTRMPISGLLTMSLDDLETNVLSFSVEEKKDLPSSDDMEMLFDAIKETKETLPTDIQNALDKDLSIDDLYDLVKKSNFSNDLIMKFINAYELYKTNQKGGYGPSGRMYTFGYTNDDKDTFYRILEYNMLGVGILPEHYDQILKSIIDIDKVFDTIDYLYPVFHEYMLKSSLTKYNNVLQKKVQPDTSISQIENEYDALSQQDQIITPETFTKDEEEVFNKLMQDTSYDELIQVPQSLQSSNDIYQSGTQNLQSSNDAYQSNMQNLQSSNDAYQSGMQNLQSSNDAYQSGIQQQVFVTQESPQLTQVSQGLLQTPPPPTVVTQENPQLLTLQAPPPPQLNQQSLLSSAPVLSQPPTFITQENPQFLTLQAPPPPQLNQPPSQIS